MRTALLSLLLTSSALLQAQGTFVIVNPIAGGTDKEEVVQELRKAFDAKVFYTERKGHATLFAKQAVESQTDVVIAVGGDGTIHEIGQALIGSKTALGIIPTGSGNGLARSLHIPNHIPSAIDIIRRGHRASIDTVRINDRSYLGIAGIGFDAEVGWRFSEFGHRGFVSYLLVTLQAYPEYRPADYELVIDGQKMVHKAFLISFANSPQFGNGAVIAPHANMRDGFLEVVILNPFPWYEAPNLAYKLFNGHFNRSRHVKEIKAKDVVIKQPNLKMHIDGEPVIFPDGAHLTVDHASLQVIVP